MTTRSRALAVQSVITGRVVDALTGAGPRFPVTVRLLDRDDPGLGEYPLHLAQTADGRYSFSGDPDTAFPRLATAAYHLRLEAGADFFQTAQVDFDLGPAAGQPAEVAVPVPDHDPAAVNLFTGGGLPLEIADLALQPEPVALDGRVVRHGTSTGIDGAGVAVDGGPSTTTAADGRFTFAALPVQAAVTLNVTATGFEAAVVTHQIAYGRARNALVVSLQETT